MSVQPISELRRDVIRRLSASADRWQSIGHVEASQGKAAGDSFRIAKRLKVLAAVLKSRKYAVYAPDDILSEYERLPTVQLAAKIIERMPREIRLQTEA